MSTHLSRKTVLAGLAAALASAGSVGAKATPKATKVERDALGRIVKWTGDDGTAYTVQYRNDFPELRLRDYPGFAAYAFQTVVMVSKAGVKTAAMRGFAWGPAAKAPLHAREKNDVTGVFLQQGFDNETAIARAARSRLQAHARWAEQDFLEGVKDALKHPQSASITPTFISFTR